MEKHTDNKGIVTKNTGSWYFVKKSDGEVVECRIRGNFRMQGIRSTNPIAIGDYVEFIVGEDYKGTITKIQERKNYIIRRSSNLSKKSHIIAANIDQAVIIATMIHPFTTTTFIDRFLATAQAYRIKARIVFNKIDIYSPEAMEQMDDLIYIYEKIGYECHSISVKQLTNISTLQSILENKTSLLSGHSGVGKSSLINILAPGTKLKTSDISDSHKSGKHTTTFSEMIPLPFGGYIIDTPGIRGFGTVDFESEEIYHYFPDIFKVAKNCRFHNCLHLEEPGCAVKEAVEAGEIAYSRYTSYLNILEDPEDTKYRS